MYLNHLLKAILMPLGLPVATSPIDAAIHKKMFGSGLTTLISTEKINDIIKMLLKYLGYR